MPKKHVSPKIDAVRERATRSFFRHFTLVVPGKGKGVFLSKILFFEYLFFIYIRHEHNTYRRNL